MQNLDRWLGIVANFGVVLGIIFLGIEIQQNTQSLDEGRKYAAAAAYQARADTAVQLLQNQDPEILIKLGADRLSEIDRVAMLRRTSAN